MHEINLDALTGAIYDSRAQAIHSMKTIRIFISSPGDVGRERHKTAEVIKRLQNEFAEYAQIDPYFWEWEPCDLSKDYQANIPSTSDFDIVICLLWSRLGSRLGEQHKLPPDYTRVANSGTEYELIQALHGKEQHPQGLPDLLVWVNKAPPPPATAPPLTEEKEDEAIAQRRALNKFISTLTRDASTGTFIAAVNSYKIPSEDLDQFKYLDQFEELMEKKLRKLILKHTGNVATKLKAQWQGSPFRDLDVFEFEHAPIFFGRSRAVGEVVRLLQETSGKPKPCHFVLVLGASGSGKSSLARAGVLPMLTRPGVIEGVGLWRCAIMRPSDDSSDLFLALASALLRVASDKPNGCPAALPELADPEAADSTRAIAEKLRANPESVADNVAARLIEAARTEEARQRREIEEQIRAFTNEGRAADAEHKREALEQLKKPPVARLALLLDQMEELFTQNYAPEHLRAFLAALDVLSRCGRVFVLGTFRSDFYPRYQEQPLLVALTTDGARYDLLPPAADEISQIIRRPARLAGLEFEENETHSLADTLRDEALADPEALPLLEHVLNRLYEYQSTRKDGRLTFEDHKTLGGVGGALGKHAEDTLTLRVPTATDATFDAVFRCLITLGEGEQVVPNRRTFPRPDLIKADPNANELVTAFENARLFIADRDTKGNPVVRLSHEALLTRWPRLSQWLQTAQVRDFMSMRRRLESSLRQWQEQGRNTDYLLPVGLPLEEAKQLLLKHEAALRQEEKEFIDTSSVYNKKREQAELARERSRREEAERLKIKADASRRIANWLAIVTMILAVSACIGCAYAWLMEKKANAAIVESNRQLERYQLEEGRAWLERGRAAMNKVDHLSALMLAGRAFGYQGYGRDEHEATKFAQQFPVLLGKPMTNEIVESERVKEAKQVTEFIGRIRPTYLPIWSIDLMIQGERQGPECVAFSPDSARLACGFIDGIIKFYDSASGKELKSTQEHKKGVNVSVTCVAFSPDGMRLASGTEDNTIKLWDVVTGEEIESFKGIASGVNSIAFSPDGSRIVSGSLGDDSLKIWDAATGQELTPRNIHANWVTCVAFSPDGARLANGNGTRLENGATLYTIKIWDVASGNEIATMEGHRDSISSIAFSPDGARLVSSSNDHTVRLWESATGKQLPFLLEHTEPVNTVAFSSDGARLASGSDDVTHLDDHTIKLWDASKGNEIATLQGHHISTRGVVFSPDGTRLASCSPHDGLKLWDVASGGDVLNLTGHAKLVTTVAITSESTRLASGSEDTTIKIWDTGSGRQLITLKGHKKVVTKVTFSPDDARLASCSEDGTIKLWDAVTGRELTTLEGSTAEVTYVAFSPDGTQLASVSRDFKIKLWDVVSGKEQRNLYSTDPVARVAFSPDGKRLAGESWLGQIMMWDTTTGGYFFLEPVGTDFAAFQKRYESTAAPREWLEHIPREVSCDGSLRFHMEDKSVSLQNTISPNLNLAERLRNGILELSGRELSFEHLSDSQGLSFQMLPVWNDTLAQLANSNLTPAKRAELQMQLCAKSGQHRAATAQWQRLQRGEWPGFEASIVPKEQSPATVPDDSTIRRLYLITLIDATRRGDVIGHATACQTAAQIAPVLTKEMMALPTVSLGLMSLMRSLQKDGSPDMAGPRETLLKRLEEFASKEWLEVLHTSVAE